MDAEKYATFAAKKDLDTKQYKNGVSTVIECVNMGQGGAMNDIESNRYIRADHQARVGGGTGLHIDGDGKDGNTISWEDRLRSKNGTVGGLPSF